MNILSIGIYVKRNSEQILKRETNIFVGKKNPETNIFVGKKIQKLIFL